MTINQSQSLIYKQFCRELWVSIEVVANYTRIIIEEIEQDKSHFAYSKKLQELQQIEQCSLNLFTSLGLIFSTPERSGDLVQVVNSPKLKMELKKLTECIDDYCASTNAIQKGTRNYLVNIDDLDGLLLEIKNLSQILLQKERILPLTYSNNTPTNSNSLKKLKTDCPRILIVDDSPINQTILSCQVKDLGYQIATATDGKQAISMIEAEAYDLILLDIVMPEINGYEVLNWIRSNYWHYLPTIVISSLDRIDSMVKCIEMGAADYLTRPYNPVLLKARLASCLEQKKLREQESSYLEQLANANAKISQLNNRLQAENNHLNAELEITQRLQAMLLPTKHELSQIEGLEVAGFMEPADKIGGDYYDVLQHYGSTIVGIGDVTGHGLESGILMLMVQTAVRTLIEDNQTDPKQFFEVLNRTIYKNMQRLDRPKYLSLCLVDYREGTLRLSGQHEQTIVVRSSGIVEKIDTIDLGFPIGLKETIKDFIFQVQIPLAPNDAVILYTDGVTEAENNLGVHYGLERLCAVVGQNYHQSAEKIGKTVIESIRSHIGGAKVYDDITLVVLKRR